MKERAVVIIPTFAPMVRLAGLTARRLRELWADCPPIVFCGAQPDGERRFGINADSATWMMVLKSCVQSTLGAGFDLAYVVLDDHPPMDRCHALHLNSTLPQWMRDTGAAKISLDGWGQGRSSLRGTLVDPKRFPGLEHMPPDFLWTLSLHPSLWDIRALDSALDALIANLPEDQQTPWQFERFGGGPQSPVGSEIRNASYRVHGLSMVNGHVKHRSGALVQAALRACADLLQSSNPAPALAWAYHYYRGPYPLFYSGIMKKKALNADFLAFAQITGRRALLQASRDAAFETMTPRSTPHPL